MKKGVKLKFSYKQLTALNETWERIQGLNATNAKQKAMLSVMQELAMKLQKKQVALQFKYDATSKYAITLKDHEAYFFEMYLRDIISTIAYGYTRNVVNQFADFIHQKIA